MPHKQSGNAFIYVLVAIALFGALAYTFMRSSQQGSGDISQQEASIAAAGILSFARSVEEAVNRVRVKNRCSENEISFEHNGVYVNPSAPGTKKCHIFDPAGGNITYSAPDDEKVFTNGSQNYVFNAGFQLTKIGTDLNDLVLQLNYLSEQICITINNRLGVSNSGGTPPAENNDPGDVNFVGTFGTNKTNTIGDDGTGLSGKSGFCRNQASVPQYQFNYVLLAR